MAKKRVSRRPDSFFKGAGASARRAMLEGLSDEDLVKFIDNRSDEEIRLASNKWHRDLYERMKSPEGNHIYLNYPGGPWQFFKDVESGMYDD